MGKMSKSSVERGRVKGEGRGEGKTRRRNGKVIAPEQKVMSTTLSRKQDR